MILEFGEQGGVKMFIPPVVGYGYFLESPNIITGNCIYSYTVPFLVKSSGHNMERTLLSHLLSFGRQ